MKHHGRRMAAILLLVTVSLAPATRNAMGVDAGEEDAAALQAIARAWREHIEAAIRKDLDAVVEMYADDIVYSVAGSPEVRGRKAIRVMEERGLAENDVLSAEHASDAVRAFGDVAYELGSVIGPVRAGEGSPGVVRFHFMAKWRRQADGGWRIEHLVGGSVE